MLGSGQQLELRGGDHCYHGVRMNYANHSDRVASSMGVA